jgi:diadenosine tetraphosphatase ApaH/serine/threonine PP2A family protein phosphatase
MKYAIILDIHGNLEALHSVLSDIDKKNIDEILCLGDVVGYGPNPNECVDIIREKARITLAGNHDYAPLGKIDLTYFNPWAKNAIDWTENRLTQASKEFLLNLPLKQEMNGFTIVHATPQNPHEWYYITSLEEAIINFPEFEGQVCFVGHSHVPLVVALDEEGEYRVVRSNPLKFSENERYIINVGSVGQPRDLDPRAAYALFDSREKVYELLRIEYDLAETQRKIRESGLPEFLAVRLERGQ